MVRILHTFEESSTYVDKNLVIYQSLRTIIVRKGLGIEKKKYAEKYASLMFEHGFSKKYSRNLPNFFSVEAKRGGRDGFVHYDHLQEYLDANTRVTALPFDKLDYLFRGYFAFVTAILLLNLVYYLVHRCVRKIKMRKIQVWFLRTVSLIFQVFRFFGRFSCVMKRFARSLKYRCRLGHHT